MIDSVKLRSVCLKNFVEMVDKVGRDLGVLRVEIRHFARASLSLSVGTSANAKALPLPRLGTFLFETFE